MKPIFGLLSEFPVHWRRNCSCEHPHLWIESLVSPKFILDNTPKLSQKDTVEAIFFQSTEKNSTKIFQLIWRFFGGNKNHCGITQLQSSIHLSSFQASVAKRCLVRSLFLYFGVYRWLPRYSHLTRVSIRYSACMARYKQEKQVQLDAVLTCLICTRVASQVQSCTLTC